MTLRRGSRAAWRHRSACRPGANRGNQRSLSALFGKRAARRSHLRNTTSVEFDAFEIRCADRSSPNGTPLRNVEPWNEAKLNLPPPNIVSDTVRVQYLPSGAAALMQTRSSPACACSPAGDGQVAGVDSHVQHPQLSPIWSWTTSVDTNRAILRIRRSSAVSASKTATRNDLVFVRLHRANPFAAQLDKRSEQHR